MKNGCLPMVKAKIASGCDNNNNIVVGKITNILSKTSLGKGECRPSKKTNLKVNTIPGDYHSSSAFRINRIQLIHCTRRSEAE